MTKKQEIKCGSPIFNKYLGAFKFYVPFKLINNINITVWFTDLDVFVRNMSFLNKQNISIKDWDIVYAANNRNPKKIEINIGCIWYNPTNITKQFCYDVYNSLLYKIPLNNTVFDQDVAQTWIWKNVQYGKLETNDYDTNWKANQLEPIKQLALHLDEGIMSYHIFGKLHNINAIRSLDILETEKEFQSIDIIHWTGVSGSIYKLWYAKVSGFYTSKYYYNYNYSKQNKIINIY
eukprot:332578_1